jgi:hypothetical protein
MATSSPAPGQRLVANRPWPQLLGVNLFGFANGSPPGSRSGSMHAATSFVGLLTFALMG